MGDGEGELPLSQSHTTPSQMTSPLRVLSKISAVWGNRESGGRGYLFPWAVVLGEECSTQER